MIVNFIGRIFLTTLVSASIVIITLTALSYVFNTSSAVGSRAVFASGNEALMLYESLRISLKLLLGIFLATVILTVIFSLLELIAIVWRGVDFKTAYLDKVQTGIVKSSLGYDELFDLCEDAMLNYRAKITKADKSKGLIKAKIKSKITGMIEDVTIAVRKDGRVFVSSESVRNFANMYGASTIGHNVRNVRSVVEYLEKQDPDAKCGDNSAKKGVSKSIAILSCIGMTILVGVGALFVIPSYGGMNRLLQGRSTTSSMSADTQEQPMTESMVRESVRQLKESNSLPMEIGEGAVLTDITEGPEGIRYHVTFDGAGYDVTPGALKANIVSNACQSEDGRELLDAGIVIVYVYTIRETGATGVITLASGDCEGISGNPVNQV